MQCHPEKNSWNSRPICRQKLKPLTLKVNFKYRLATVLFGEFQPVPETRSKSSGQSLAAKDFYFKKQLYLVKGYSAWPE